jgi:hypothetical protein
VCDKTRERASGGVHSESCKKALCFVSAGAQREAICASGPSKTTSGFGANFFAGCFESKNLLKPTKYFYILIWQAVKSLILKHAQSCNELGRGTKIIFCILAIFNYLFSLLYSLVFKEFLQ